MGEFATLRKLDLGEELVGDIDRLAVRESYLLIGLMQGKVGELFFHLSGRKYHMKATLAPYKLTIEPFDN